MSNPKEPEYFATDFPLRLIRREKDYIRLFSKADPLRHLVVGEGSTIYLFSREAVPNIISFNPHARFVVMIRNPVDLVVSLHSFLVSRGAETYRNFWDAWEIEEKRRTKGMSLSRVRNPQLFWYSEWGRLGTQLQRVLEIIPQSRLKVIFYDDFILDAKKEYSTLLDFLGLPHNRRTEYPVFNERRQPKNYIIQNWFGIIKKSWLLFRVYFTGGRGLGVGEWLYRMLTKPVEKKSIIYIEKRDLLIDFYREEIHLLEKLLERDLSHWLEASE